MFLFPNKTEAASPEDIKAAYVYQFVKYITWPNKNPANTDLVIYFINAPEIYAVLKIKDGAMVEGKKLSLKQARNPEEVPSAHIVFVGEAYNNPEKAIQMFNSKGILTIGESHRFARKGGMINFVLSQENTIQFEINWEVAKAQGFEISSKLLQLAILVSSEN